MDGKISLSILGAQGVSGIEGRLEVLSQVVSKCISAQLGEISGKIKTLPS
jgi:hypothetical protein